MPSSSSSLEEEEEGGEGGDTGGEGRETGSRLLGAVTTDAGFELYALSLCRFLLLLCRCSSLLQNVMMVDGVNVGGRGSQISI